MAAAAKPRSSWRNTAATIAILSPIVGYVVYGTLTQAAVECDVCIRYRGEKICRTVEGTTESEAIRAAVDNACGPVAGGVTETVRCTTTPPVSASCRPLS